MSPAENEKLPKKQLEERSIKLTENSVLRNKPLKGKNSYYIVDAHPGKITESIILDEPDDSNKTEQNIAISEHPVQPQNSNNSVTIWHRKKRIIFQKNWKDFILKLKQLMFINEQFFILKSSIENIDVKNENQETNTKRCILNTKAVKQRTHQAIVHQKCQQIIKWFYSKKMKKKTKTPQEQK